MVHHKTKMIKGKVYNYLIENVKFEGRVHQVQKYLGPGKMKKKDIEEAIMEHCDWFKNETIKKKATLASARYHCSLFKKEQLFQLEASRYLRKEFLRGLHPNEIESYEREFDLGYVHSTTATEGNTCTLAEVTRILERGLTPKGKSLREIYEIRNFEDVLRYRKGYKGNISKRFILKLHKLVMRDIDRYTIGAFRRIEVAILGSKVKLTPATFVEKELEELIEWYDEKKDVMHPVELATRFHVKFESIHPFTDGNGRVGREIFNLMVTRKRYPPLNFDVKRRDEYLDGLEAVPEGDWKLLREYVMSNYIEHMRRKHTEWFEGSKA